MLWDRHNFGLDKSLGSSDGEVSDLLLEKGFLLSILMRLIELQSAKNSLYYIIQKQKLVLS